MIKFNLLTEKKENDIYEEELTNVFFDGLRDGEYGFIIKMDIINNTGLLHWETSGDLSVEPIPLYEITYNYDREVIRVGNFNYPGKLSGKLSFMCSNDLLEEICNKIIQSLYNTQIILITSYNKTKIKTKIKEVHPMYLVNTTDRVPPICTVTFNIENYETII
jgi:hypothetical protein